MANTANIQLNGDYLGDFGFSIIDKEDLINDDSYKNKMYIMYKMILPLLENLLKNPEKDIIHWPNRKPRIEKFIKDLKALIE